MTHTIEESIICECKSTDRVSISGLARLLNTHPFAKERMKGPCYGLIYQGSRNAQVLDLQSMAFRVVRVGLIAGISLIVIDI